MARITPLQQFKARMAHQARVTLIDYQVNGTAAKHKYLGVPRMCGAARSTQFALCAINSAELSIAEHRAQFSYCEWPKASELEWIDADTASIKSHGVFLVYRFEPTAAAAR